MAHLRRVRQDQALRELVANREEKRFLSYLSEGASPVLASTRNTPIDYIKDAAPQEFLPPAIAYVAFTTVEPAAQRSAAFEGRTRDEGPLSPM
ncbi:hypothetical protein LLH23_15070 [bacterium]|nr:hypothetical protein [bacterium]